MPSAHNVAELRVAPVTRADLDAVASLHMRAFPDGALTVFGVDIVRRYYVWLLEGPHDAAVVGAWRGTMLLGFCAAGWFRGAMNGFLRANRWYLARRLVRHPSLLAAPLVRDRIVQAHQITFRYSRLATRSSGETTGGAGEPRFGVLSIATDPAVRGSGAGRALMLEAEQRARAQGHRAMVLTVHPDNTRAVQFYEQLGWHRCPDADGGWAGRMEKPLT